MWGGVWRRREGATSKGREGIGGKGRGKGEEGRGRESGRGSVVLLGGLTPLAACMLDLQRIRIF